MDPWTLVIDHRYEEAERAYQERLDASGEEDSLQIANYATVLLCLGRLPEALAGFKRANLLASQAMSSTAPYTETLAVVQWLMGDYEGAIDTLRGTAEGILAGSITFTDNAGGAQPGLLLWYAGISSRHAAATDFALTYLTQLTTTKRARYWPGPLALLSVGRMSLDDILNDEFNTADLKALLGTARLHMLTRRKLVQALFYQATKHRQQGEATACRDLMQKCAALENPVVQLEWYLAKKEADDGRAAMS